jgi:hypothetical protein
MGIMGPNLACGVAMWMRVAKDGKIYWFNLARVGMIKLDLEDEYALKVHVDTELGTLVCRSPETGFEIFEDDWLAMQAMLEDIRKLPVHPSYLR